MTSTYVIQQSTRTHADAIAAVGLADLLAPVGDSIIEDDAEGGRYLVNSKFAAGSDVSFLGQSAGFLFLRPNDKTPVPADLSAGEFYDYPRMKEAEKRARDARKSKKGVSSEIAELIAAEGPGADHSLYRTLNLLQGDGVTNKAFLWVKKKGAARLARNAQ